MQLTDRKPLRELESWVLDNLTKSLNVPVLAERVAMSPRNFARVFTKEMKTTPAKFVERLRVEAARDWKKVETAWKRSPASAAFGMSIRCAMFSSGH